MGKLISPIIFILLSIIVLPFAYAINPIGLPQFSHETSKGTASVTLTFESTQLKENGLIELQMYQGFPAQAIFGNPTTCDPLKPYQKAVPYAFDQIGERLTITITNDNIPDGSYSPMLVHVDRCCSTGSCNAQQPFGWGYPLTSGNIIFKSQTTFCTQVITKACYPSTKQIQYFSNSCLPSGWTADISQCQQAASTKSFKLSNLKKAGIFDVPLSGQFQFLTLNIGARKGNLYYITITNTGGQAAGATLELYFVSKLNSFYNQIIGLQSQTYPLQTALGQQGITLNTITTCKNDIGATYIIDPLAPGESKTFVVFVPVPSGGSKEPALAGQNIPEDMLLGQSNYNPSGEYLLIADIFDNCQAANVYDSIGGTINFVVSGGVTQYDQSGGDVPTQFVCNPNTLQGCPKKIAIDKDKLPSLTDKDIVASQCISSSECSNNNCVSMKKLVDDGFLTSTDANKYSTSLKSTVTGIALGTTGGVLACILGAGAAFTSAIFTGGLGAVAAVPVAAGLCAGGGALVGGVAGYWTGEAVIAIKSNDLTKVGFCVDERQEKLTFEGVTTSIGKAVNEFFGTRNKVSDFVLGAIVIGFVLFLIFTKK